MTNQPWQTNEPPKDGTAIVAVGRVIWSDEMSTSVDQFVAAIRWEKDSSGCEGWRYNRDGPTVARELGDEVKVDWWANFPKEEAACNVQSGTKNENHASPLPLPAQHQEVPQNTATPPSLGSLA